MNPSKLVQALSLARRGRGLEIGFDATESALKSGRAAAVVVTEDIAERTLRNAVRLADGRAELLRLPVDSDVFEPVFKKRFVVAAVTDENFAELVRRAVADL